MTVEDVVMQVEHRGQHGPQCYGCKLKSLNLDTGGFKKHNPQGRNHWETDPVKQRIEELTGSRIDTDEMAKRSRDQ